MLNCTSGTCVEAGRSADGDSEESVTLANPAPGAWKVRVEGFAVPAGSTTFNYVDVFTNPAFGSVAVTDATAPRPSGMSWEVPGSVTARSPRRSAGCSMAPSRCGPTRTSSSAAATSSWRRSTDRSHTTTGGPSRFRTGPPAFGAQAGRAAVGAGAEQQPGRAGVPDRKPAQRVHHTGRAPRPYVAAGVAALRRRHPEGCHLTVGAVAWGEVFLAGCRS